VIFEAKNGTPQYPVAVYGSNHQKAVFPNGFDRVLKEIIESEVGRVFAEYKEEFKRLNLDQFSIVIESQTNAFERRVVNENRDWVIENPSSPLNICE